MKPLADKDGYYCGTTVVVKSEWSDSVHNHVTQSPEWDNGDPSFRPKWWNGQTPGAVTNFLHVGIYLIFSIHKQPIVLEEDMLYVSFIP